MHICVIIFRVLRFKPRHFPLLGIWQLFRYLNKEGLDSYFSDESKVSTTMTAGEEVARTFNQIQKVVPIETDSILQDVQMCSPGYGMRVVALKAKIEGS